MAKTLGTILIVFGLIALIWGGFSYTTQKRILDIGPIKADKTEHHTVPIPAVAGVAALVAGGVLVASGRR